MGIQYANSEIVARAWLLGLPGIPAGKVNTTLPQDKSSWSETGFVQIAVTGGSPTTENSLRRPVITATCWAVNPASKNSPAPNMQPGKAPWGKANDLAEAIVRGCEAENGRGVTLSPAAAPGAQVLQAWVLSEPRRSPVQDGNPVARYVVDFQIAWVELT
ncbi:hypothetical protein J7E88_07885 [Streptomyces sp. ISL-10]|uniref:hypothetical protein n=1 Tax=Streptomyces sp. ISL-10 TaxID=2819172 RepID=UPI001BECA608|nr:hypothetical protein [Streptomyces sp. ISL-10]MBT2365242.1 hypothetical protein [Streptomyces sp. ISL-10]